MRKHRVSLEEARTAFSDDNAPLMADPDRSDDEERFVLLGLSARLRALVVCHCYRQHGTAIRIISARRADPLERATYDERWRR